MTTSDNAERVRLQRDILFDPFRFAETMWEPVFASRLADLCYSVYDRPSRTNCDEALRLVERAIRTPGANVQVGLDFLGDLITNHAMDAVDIGQRQGIILEQLRQAMVDYISESAAAAADTSETGDLRDEHRRLDELAAGEGQALVELRDRIAANVRLADLANDGADEGAAAA